MDITKRTSSRTDAVDECRYNSDAVLRKDGTLSVINGVLCAGKYGVGFGSTKENSGLA